MSSLRYSESIVVACPPEDLYDMVSDVTRMGEWSPVCKACWWDEGDGPRPGAWFTGRNELPERTWETRSQVVAADRGREFAFMVGGAWVRLQAPGDPGLPRAGAAVEHDHLRWRGYDRAGDLD